jgi:hypothetical protein
VIPVFRLDGRHGRRARRGGALDAYSRVVTTVAARMTPHVAAVQVSARDLTGHLHQGAGSAVVFTRDGFLLTNAHVVGVDPLSDLAGASGTGGRPAHRLR